MNHLYKILIVLFLLLNISEMAAQQDSTRRIGFAGIPVVASAPETGFKYGAFGQVSFPLFKDDFESRASQAKLGITYSIKKQLSIETAFLLFGRNENYFIRGNIEYQNWFDRHYGLGNDASNQIIEHRFEDNTIDTLNFLNYGVDLFLSRISFNKKIRKGLFVGLLTNIYNSNNFSISADSTEFQTNEIRPNDMVGQYLGVGLNVIYDTRDNVNNPSIGTFIRFSNLNYRKWLGGDFEFYTVSLDARKYFNVVKDQTFAVRMLVGSTISDDVIPFTGYQRLGGKRILRGYFNGTYLDKNIMTFDAEYRLPLFQEESAPIYKIWKHFGIVAFVSAGQVAEEWGMFDFSEFRVAVGGGVRFLLSKAQRTNIRVDYGIGLQKDAGGLGKKQRGLYITVNEAF